MNLLTMSICAFVALGIVAHMAGLSASVSITLAAITISLASAVGLIRASRKDGGDKPFR